MEKFIQLFDNLMQKLGYVKVDAKNEPVIDFSQEIDEFQSFIYKGGNCLYNFEPKSGRIWSLRTGDYAGEHGTPLPGYIEGIGEMTLLGVFNLSD
jgi:hypothetical protein